MSSKRVRTHVNPLSITKEFSFEGFDNNKSIFVDVGAYKGEFVDKLSEKFPNCNYIVFEIRRPIADKLREKFAGRDNFVVFDGDAGRNFRAILEPSLKKGVEIKQIFVNFPDPWFKEKHKKRRFINAKFLKSLENWLPNSVEFVFQTDQQFVFDETVELLADNNNFEITKKYNESIHGITTNWEDAKLALNLPIYRMIFKKK
jgi:tRNA (guanine-N7-)-methyltransferase